MNGPWLMPIEDDLYKESERLRAEVERLEQRNHLEAAVVAAALTLRRAENEKTFPAKMGWSEAWGRGVDTLGEATDALLAFNADAMANDAHTCQRDRSVL